MLKVIVLAFCSVLLTGNRFLSSFDNESFNLKSSQVSQISENWFATSIAASYTNTDENFRVISYADHLDANSKTLTLYQSVVAF